MPARLNAVRTGLICAVSLPCKSLPAFRNHGFLFFYVTSESTGGVIIVLVPTLRGHSLNTFSLCSINQRGLDQFQIMAAVLAQTLHGMSKTHLIVCNE
jgi:hypothetical protein